MAIYNRFFSLLLFTSYPIWMCWYGGLEFCATVRRSLTASTQRRKIILETKICSNSLCFSLFIHQDSFCEHLKSMSDVKVCIICKINEADKYLCSVWKEGINRDLSVGWGLSRSRCKSGEAFSTPKSVRWMARKEQTLVCCTRLMTWSSGTCTYLNVNASRI